MKNINYYAFAFIVFYLFITSCSNQPKELTKEKITQINDLDSIESQNPKIVEHNYRNANGTITFYEKGIWIDSIQYSISESDDSIGEYFFHFYYKGNRYSQDFYFGTVHEKDFSFKHMNNDKFRDLVFQNSGASGQGCMGQEIFLFDANSKRYLRHEYLSSHCYLEYNKKLDVYSTYYRGSGQKGPWFYELSKLENDSLIAFESLFHEIEFDNEVNYPDTVIVNNCFTHIYKGDTITYTNLKENNLGYCISASKHIKTLTKSYYIRQ